MDVRDFVTNRNPEFAMNIELFEEHEERNLEGEEKEEFLKARKEGWNTGDMNKGERWMAKYNAEKKAIYDEEWRIYLNPVLQKI